jgi:two-component system, chemotaxis family, response regulator Rcp1
MNVVPIDILLVEDSPSDVLLTREALRDARIANDLSVARDGEEAMEYLRQEGDHADKPRPDIVILDLNLPRKDGREVLREIKGDDSLRRIPVVVLTTSSSDRDIGECYDSHANCFLTKPIDFEEFIDVVRSMEHFWISVVRLPPN